MAAKAGLTLTLLLVVAGCGSSHPAQKPSPAALPSASSAASPTASATPSVDAALASWAKGGGLDKIDAVTTDLAAIHDAGSDASLVRDGCAELESSAAAAQFYKPIPQAAAQRHWAAALASFKLAAGECLAGIDENKPALLQKTSTDIDKGTTELAATTKTLRLG
ncbi:MAG TPA: hypothetical protein VHZ96_22940 [Frankiaceae bacterium]|jgi:hypothetical protein|nr:hypothetical protein [Frankiaceae bacterium]